jgi:CHAD domain-containing protein
MPRPPLPAQILRQRLRALLEALPAAQSGDVPSVHRARVASRRLREVLPVIAEAAGSGQLGRASKDVRRITRALGPIRELDVALGHLQEVGPRTGVPARTLAILRRHLNAERLVHRRTMLDVITPRAAARLRARLGSAHGPAFSGSPASPQHLAELHSARRRAARRAVRLRIEIGRAGGLYDPERLHAVRVATKKLRYSLEVDRELSRSRATARINRLGRLQDALGQIHDFEILLEHTREVQASLIGVDRRAATELDGLVRTLETECRDGHAAFVGDRAAIETVCQQVIEAAREGRPTFM